VPLPTRPPARGDRKTEAIRSAPALALRSPLRPRASTPR
jgi:hypothetical protein